MWNHCGEAYCALYNILEDFYYETLCYLFFPLTSTDTVFHSWENGTHLMLMDDFFFFFKGSDLFVRSEHPNPDQQNWNKLCNKRYVFQNLWRHIFLWINKNISNSQLDKIFGCIILISFFSSRGSNPDLWILDFGRHYSKQQRVTSLKIQLITEIFFPWFFM